MAAPTLDNIRQTVPGRSDEVATWDRLHTTW